MARWRPVLLVVAAALAFCVAACPVAADAPRFHPGGEHPGLYAARDHANLDPLVYPIVGGQQLF